MKHFIFRPCLLHQIYLYHPPTSHLTPSVLPGFSLFQLIPTTDPLHWQGTLARALCSLKDPASSFLTFRSQLQCHVLGEPFLTSPNPRYHSHYCFILVQLSAFMPHLLFRVVCSFLLEPSIIRLGSLKARIDLLCSLCKHPTCIYGYNEWIDRLMNK